LEDIVNLKDTICVIITHIAYGLLSLSQMSTVISNKPTSFGDYQDFDPNSTPNVEYKVESPVQPAVQPIVQSVPESNVQVVVPVTSSTGMPIEIKTQGTTGVVEKQTTVFVAPSCQINEAPWPTIIISVLGAIVVIYTAVAPNVDENRRVFGIVLMVLWTLIWALILWVLWKECHRSASWWLLLIPVIIMALFFILIIIMNVGSSI
jgi:hypothetical protein